MSIDKELKDIKYKNECFREIGESLDKLDTGFMALGIDHGYHTEGHFTGDHSIFELRDNVKYRLQSSYFHLELLFRHLYHIEQAIDKKFRDNPQIINNQYFPNNPHFRNYEFQVSSLFDSIVFHLASIYDYMSLLINYVCGGKKEERIIWTQLTKSARNKNDKWNRKKIASIIDTIDRQFVSILYDYRSEVIHRESNLTYFRHTFHFFNKNSEVSFLCGSKLIRKFRKLIDPEKDYTVSFFCKFLIDNTFSNVADLLNNLKYELEKNSQFPNNLRHNKPMLVYVDPVSRRAMSPALDYWKTFQDHFRISDIR